MFTSPATYTTASTVRFYTYNDGFYTYNDGFYSDRRDSNCYCARELRADVQLQGAAQVHLDDEFCITNDGICIKSDESCIKDDEFLHSLDISREFLLGSARAASEIVFEARHRPAGGSSSPDNDDDSGDVVLGTAAVPLLPVLQVSAY